MLEPFAMFRDYLSTFSGSMIPKQMRRKVNMQRFLNFFGALRACILLADSYKNMCDVFCVSLFVKTSFNVFLAISRLLSTNPSNTTLS